MLRNSRDEPQSAGWTPILRSRIGNRRNIAAAINDDRSRILLRLAQVMTGERDKMTPDLGDQTLR